MFILLKKILIIFHIYGFKGSFNDNAFKSGYLDLAVLHEE